MRTVLIVDDDASVRNSVQKVLAAAGYNVVVAANGDQAIKQFENKRPDLMLLDIGLAVQNGWDTFERITNEAPMLPIIVITGQANHYDTVVAAGVGALMEKPLDAPKLLDVIKELLTESVESRLRRLCGYDGNTRREPPASSQLLHDLQARTSSAVRGSFANRLHSRRTEQGQSSIPTSLQP